MFRLSVVIPCEAGKLAKSDAAAFARENNIELIGVHKNNITQADEESYLKAAGMDEKENAMKDGARCATGRYTAFVKKADAKEIKEALLCCEKAEEMNQDYYFSPEESKENVLFGKVLNIKILIKAIVSMQQLDDSFILPAFLMNVYECDVQDCFDQLYEVCDKGWLLDKLRLMNMQQTKNLRYISFERKIEKRDIKNVAFFYNRLHDGGIERVMTLLSKEFTEKGKKCFVITKEDKHSNDFTLAEGVTRICLHEHEKDRYTHLMKVLRDSDIDVICYNNAFDPTLILDIIAAKTAGVYAVIHQHGVYSTPMHAYEEDVRMLDKAYRSGDALVVLSDIMKQYYMERGIKTQTVYNPVMTSLRGGERSDLSGDILFIGRISRDKQPEKAIEVMRYVAREVPDIKLRFVGGCEHGGYLESLQQLADDFGIGDRIVFEGYTHNIEAYLRKAKMQLFVSLIEGQPLAILETKAFGVPLVGFKLNYICYFYDGRGISSADFNDSKGAAKKIIELLKDEDKLKKLADDAAESFEFFRDYDYIQKWMDLFEDIKERPEHPERHGFTPGVVDDILDAFNERPRIGRTDISSNDVPIVATLFYANNKYFVQKRCLIKTLSSKEKLLFSYKLPEDVVGKVDSFRFDPAEASGLSIKFRSIRYFEGDKATELSHSDFETNAVIAEGALMFPTCDPKMIISLPNKNITKFEFEYELVDKIEAGLMVDRTLIVPKKGFVRKLGSKIMRKINAKGGALSKAANGVIGAFRKKEK